MTDVAAARRFVQLHGRLLDRRRLAHLLEGAPAAAVAAAVAAYANPDGGYAGLVEPDVRTLSSQPIAVLTAFDVLGEVGAPAPVEALAWLAAVSDDDGGIPFHLPAADGAPQAPWMRPDPASSLHMTAAVAAAALRLGATGAWVEAASAYCRRAIDAADRLSAHETMYALHLLDAVGDAPGVQALGRRLPRDGRLAVEGGTEDEALQLLDLAPRPGTAARRLFDPEVVDEELDRLAAGQRRDGGWDFTWRAWAPAVAFEWRARLTVDALAALARHGRLPAA
ncbi:hypothetical protein SAMN05428996_2140 [Quadrisphaera sp. DSM 44207]|nr:hypothetical protein SAMN05428996_2140 [Quadrisphaera sp. DSM 44207]